MIVLFDEVNKPGQRIGIAGKRVIKISDDQAVEFWQAASSWFPLKHGRRRMLQDVSNLPKVCFCVMAPRIMLARSAYTVGRPLLPLLMIGQRSQQSMFNIFTTERIHQE